jgi:hypothetical protein
VPRWIISGLTAALLCLATSHASADNIDTLSKRLSKGRTDKVRISAALSLAKSKDDRAVQALSQSLVKDRSPAIRRISAASLGQRLQQKVGSKARKNALAALKKASVKDRDAKVRSSAKIALTKADLNETTPSKKGRAKGVLVEVATPTKLSKRLPSKTASMMRSTVKKIIQDKAPSFVKTAPGTGMPSSSQLRKSGLAGFSVHPKLSKLKLVRSGRRVTVECKVEMRVQPWATKGENLAINKTATVTGSGSVTSSGSNKAIADSSQACISAVVTQVTSNQIVPFLAAKAR